MAPASKSSHDADWMLTTTCVSHAAPTQTMSSMGRSSLMSDPKLVFEFPEAQQALEHLPAAYEVFLRPLHDLHEARVRA